MARAFPNLTQSEEFSDRGEWSSLRGELVALLDQVEGRYQAEPQPGSDVDGLARRVRDLRSQVGDAPEDDRHRAALRSVKRAVDRFTERDDLPSEQDDLRAAIAEIRGRQGANPSALAPMNFGRRAADQQPMLELSTLVSQLSGRLTGLEGELRAQRSNAGQVREVASQVEQLSHVVELLAGAVGETGQVKRLETQMAGLAKLIETNGKPDLGAVNARLDELSTTMEKLAELQVQQMERDIVRDEQPKADPQIAPAMQAIENGMRSVYDRIDAMERANGSSNTEFNSELGRIAKLIESREAEPPELARLIGGLVERIDQIEQRTPDAGALRADLEDLGRTLVGVVAPRFQAIEARLGALGDDDRISRLAESLETRFEHIDQRMVQARDLTALIAAIDERMETLSARDNRSDDLAAVSAIIEDRLSSLHQRLDTTSAQIDGLRRLASEPVPAAMRAEDLAHITAELSQRTEASIDMLARKTEDSIARLGKIQGTAQPAAFDPAALGALEARLASLIETGRGAPAPGPDLEALADRVAQRTSEALGRPVEVNKPMNEADLEAFETRVADLIRANGRDTVARLDRLESTIKERRTGPRAERAADPVPAAASIETIAEPASLSGLDAVLSQLAETRASQPAEAFDPARDTMPADPDVEAPLVDRGPAADIPLVPPQPARTKKAQAVVPPPDLEDAERPPKPVSSFAEPGFDPFAETVPAAVAPAAQAEVTTRNSAQSTFIAAARRAQLARQGEAAPATNSLIGRALARVMPQKPAEPEADLAGLAPVAAAAAPAAVEPEAPAEPKARRWGRKPKPVAETEPVATLEPIAEPAMAVQADLVDDAREDHEAQPGFLARNRRALLLGVALLAVSGLALSLAMQRMNTAAPVATPAPATTEPAPETEDVSAVDPLSPRPNAGAQTAFVAPQIPDLIDATPTASIQPSIRAVGANAQSNPAALAMPASLSATPSAATEPEETAPEVEAESPVTFDLPPEGAGPQELRQAAADGDAHAQFEVAAILTEGQVVEQDLAAAATWYERAATQGFVPAEYRLGNFYETGSGVERDLELARLWYQRAAEAGHRMAMHNLAAIHASGELGAQDFTVAAEWFERAARLGMTDSQFNLGMLYARGLGVEQNFEQSYRWFSIAAARGDQDAGPAREDIARSLDAAAVARLDAEVAAWSPEPIDLAANFAPIGAWTEDFDPGEPIATTDVVARVQQVLVRLGYDVGTPDGLMGPRTRDAIREFERGTGMSESGEVNPRLLAVLGSQPV